MEVRQGYRLTEVGIIPQDWEVKQLGELFDITSSKRVYQSEWRDEGVPFYRARELAILGKRDRVENELFISREMYERYRAVYGVPKIGDLLVTGVGTLGKIYVVNNQHEFYFKDGNIIWLKSSDKIVPEFIRQLFYTKLITKQIDDGSAGTTVGTYTISGAKKTFFPYPPLPEQRAIAAALNDVDDLVASLDALIEKKRAIKQGVMQELLTGRRRLPGFSGEWNNFSLADIGDFSKGKGIKKDDVVDDGVPCIRYGEIYTHYNDHVISFVSFIPRHIAKQSQRIRKGDLLFTGSGETAEEIGKCVAFLGEEEAYAGGDIIIFKPRGQNSMYLSYLMNSVIINNQKARMGQGDAVVHISSQKLGQIQLLIPKKNEQEAIANIIYEMDNEIFTLKQQREKTSLLKQGMMQELLTGKTRLV